MIYDSANTDIFLGTRNQFAHVWLGRPPAIVLQEPRNLIRVPRGVREMEVARSGIIPVPIGARRAEASVGSRVAPVGRRPVATATPDPRKPRVGRRGPSKVPASTRTAQTRGKRRATAKASIRRVKVPRRTDVSTE